MEFSIEKKGYDGLWMRKIENGFTVDAGIYAGLMKKRI